MNPIAKHSCVRIYQEIGWTEKRIVEEWFDLELYPDKIKYNEKELKLSNVFDLSYRGTENKLGFFYLHTSNGVHSLYVKSEPTQFIESFRTIKNSY